MFEDPDQPAPQRHPGGRPTDYDPAHCKKVIEWGKAGKSRTWMAAELGVTRECVYNWMREHPEFSDAMAHALLLSQQWWEDAGQVGMVSDKFNNGVWSRSMAARFPEEWREVTRQEQTGANGGPVVVKWASTSE